MSHSPFRFLSRLIALALAAAALLTSALAEGELAPLFEAAQAALLTPAQEGMASGRYAMHTGDTAYMPFVSPGVIPFDKRDDAPAPVIEGSFSSGEEAVVTVSPDGVMTALAPGEATVTYHTKDGDQSVIVSVADDHLPELIQNYVYVLRREFYSVKRAKLPKYNQYAKWYYGKKKEVGWCSVFTIYCANAAGAEPVEEEAVDAARPPMVQFLREGQVGNQYDGFFAMNRFVGVPKPGYLVIYADMSNEYRVTHIGSVVEAVDLGQGLYRVTTVEGNMSNSVKSYCYLYNSKADNHLVGVEKGARLVRNMSVVPEADRTDPLAQYEPHTDHWSVFGFCQTWE